MLNIQKHLRQVLLAVGLAAASLTVNASVLPTYHIGVADTATADIAFIDFVFGSIDGAAPVTATLSHFTGAPVPDLDRTGAVSTIAGGYTIGNPGTYNDLFLEVDAPFAFDLNFTEAFLDFASTFDSNSLFSIALYNSNGDVVGDPSGYLNFSLAKTGVAVTSTSSLLSLTQVSAAAVPEPADWALALTGLAIVVAMTRRNGRARQFSAA